MRQALVFVHNISTRSKPRRPIMKRTTSLLILACLLVVLLAIGGFATVSTANAQLGNNGVPVRCYNAITSGQQLNLLCRAADGTTFTNVPTGHYLLVTDVRIDPVGIPDPTGWVVRLANGVSSGPDGNYLYFRGPTIVSVGEHFTTPYLLLSQGEHLQASPTGLPGGGTDVYVSGLLTTNYFYAPLIAK
jgi:hypothetical protein